MGVFAGVVRCDAKERELGRAETLQLDKIAVALNELVPDSSYTVRIISSGVPQDRLSARHLSKKLKCGEADVVTQILFASPAKLDLQDQLRFVLERTSKNRLVIVVSSIDVIVALARAVADAFGMTFEGYGLAPGRGVFVSKHFGSPCIFP